MAYINMSINNDMLNTPIPNQFIDEYLPKANPTFSCIYIYAFRHCMNGGLQLSTKDMAQAFGILESDVIKAWEYWENNKLVTIATDGAGNFSIAFLPVQSKGCAQKSTIKLHPSALSNPPEYAPMELEMYKNTYGEIRELFEKAEKILGKLLNAKELSTLYSFYDWLRLPISVIIYLLEYCAENNHRRMNYIETVAVDWAENGIDSIEKAMEYVNIYNKDYREILKALGQSSRSPAPKEVEFMKKWLTEYEMPLALILEACDKTIMALGKAQFSYTDKIIQGWHKEGAKTLDDIKAIEQKFRKTTEPKAKPVKRKSSKLQNFEPHERDFDMIEKLEREYLQNSLKGKSNA